MIPAWPMITMKNNNAKYFIDWGKITDDFTRYTTDLSSTFENRLIVSGINVNLKLIEVLEEIKDGNQRKNSRIFGTLKEHKDVLFRKFKFFMDSGVALRMKAY